MRVNSHRGPVRVVVLSHTGELGGGELALLRLCQAIDRRRALVRVILFADGPLRARLERAGIPVDIVALDESVATIDRHSAGRLSGANLRRIALMAPFGMRLIRRLRQLRPDLIQTNTLKADLIAGPVSFWVRRPLIWYLHDRIAPDYLPISMVRLTRLAARVFPRAIIANSEATARTIEPAKSTIVYPGFSPEQATPTAPQPKRLSPPVVGMIGRISPTKGQMEFVRALPAVLREHPGVTARVVGSAMFGAQGYLESVRTEATRLGLDGVIDWVDFVPDPRDELDRLSVFVHASPVPEPFGQVIVEAMIRGVPVVATRGGGATEILTSRPPSAGGTPEHESTLGLLVEPGDTDALAHAICSVLADPVATSRRAAAAWSSAIARFAIARTAQTITEVWRDEGCRPIGLITVRCHPK